MKRKTFILSIIVVTIIGISISIYFDVFNKPVKTIHDLIGKDYVYARETYFDKEPDTHYTINIKQNLNEFDSGVLTRKELLIDSLVDVYTWNYFSYKKTIWVGKTSKMNQQIIDALRYKNNVRF